MPPNILYTYLSPENTYNQPICISRTVQTLKQKQPSITRNIWSSLKARMLAKNKAKIVDLIDKKKGLYLHSNTFVGQQKSWHLSKSKFLTDLEGPRNSADGFQVYEAFLDYLNASLGHYYERPISRFTWEIGQSFPNGARINK